jgi:hypothetical protein
LLIGPILELSSRKNHAPSPEGHGAIQAVPFRSIHPVASAGAINSSVSDMLKWVQLQLSDGTLLDQQFIREETLQEMHTIQMSMPLSTPDDEIYNFGYGLGWCTGIYRGHYYLHHVGGIDGFISQVSLLPQGKIGVVVLSNSSGDGAGAFAVSCITNTIIDKLLGETNVDWIEKSKSQRDQIKKAQNEGAVQDAKSNSTPAHKLEDYVGYYEHPAYGVVQVKLENDRLFCTYGEMTLSLSHKCYDIFNGKIDQSLFGDNTMSVSFSNNTSGDICEISIPLEGSVKPIVFKKSI